MKKEYHNLIVKKSNNIEINQFNDSNEYVVTQKELGNRIVINKKTFDILNIVDGNSSLENLVLKYNAQNFSSQLTVDIAYSLLFEKLGKLGIIINENIIARKKEVASYLALSFTLISKKNLAFFIKILSPIISFKHFYKILFISLAIVSSTVFFKHKLLIETIDTIGFKQWFFYLLASGTILFLHEFGHATACKKLGAEPGAIGFGFYLLSPVMFADVSDVWKLKSKDRVYVNLAGLYIEIILALILVIGYFLTNHISFLFICSIILFSFLVNLNPLLRYDGYWVLSDMTDTPNLRKVSLQKLKLFFNYLFKKEVFLFSSKNIFLIIYACISTIFIFLFLSFILLYDPNSILSFPTNLFSYIKNLVTLNEHFVVSDLFQFILPFLFYFILTKFSFSFISKQISQFLKNRKT